MTMTGHGTGSALPPMVTRSVAMQLFFSFAFAYFLAAMLRGVTATLARYFSDDLGLNAGDLGMLGDAYFRGSAAMQLPLGSALDRFRPRRVLLSCLATVSRWRCSVASPSHWPRFCGGGRWRAA